MKYLLACFTASSVALASGLALAGNCNCCKQSRVVNPPSAPNCSSCSSGCASGGCDIKDNCLFKAIDAVSAGIDKLLHCEKGGCDDKLCDDACDAAMILDLSTPTHSHHHPHLHHHPHVESLPAPVPYLGPTQDVQITPTGPSQYEGAGRLPQMHMSEPTIEPLQDSGQHLGGDVILGPEMEVAPPVRLPQTDPEFQPRDSIFEDVSDPFRDDARVRAYQPVRPTAYDDEIYLRPINKKPLSRSQSRSSRRHNSDR